MDKIVGSTRTQRSGIKKNALTTGDTTLRELELKLHSYRLSVESCSMTFDAGWTLRLVSRGRRYYGCGTTFADAMTSALDEYVIDMASTYCRL